MTEQTLAIWLLWFKLHFTEDSVLEDTQAYRLFRAKPVTRWPPADGQPTLTIRGCVTGAIGSPAANGRTARADGPWVTFNAPT